MSVMVEQEQKATPKQANTDRPLKLAVRIFDQLIREHLTRTIQLSEQRKPGSLQLVDANVAEIVLIDPDEPGADAFIRNASRGRRPLPVVYASEQPGNEIAWLKRPAQAGDLLAIMQTMRDELASLPADKAANGQGRVRPDLLPISENQAGLDQILGLLDHATQASIHVGGITVILDGARDRIRVPRPLAEIENAALAEKITADLLATAKSPPAEGSDLIRHSLTLTELGWRLGLATSPAPEPPPDALKSTIRLERWPNFALLPHEREHLLWTGRLIRMGQTLEQMISQASGGYDSVARFYNACVLSDLLREGTGHQRKRPRKAPGSAGRSGIFSKIIQRLAG